MRTIALDLAPTAPKKPLAKRVLAAAFRFFELRRQRRHLADLSPEQLCDIGLSPHEVDAELRRPIWDAPSQFMIR